MQPIGQGSALLRFELSGRASIGEAEETENIPEPVIHDDSFMLSEGPPSAASVLRILSAGPAKASDSALQKFADFMGVETQCYSASAAVRLPLENNSSRFALAISQNALNELYQEPWFIALLGQAAFLLIYAFQAELPIDGLSWLTKGGVTGVQRQRAGFKVFAVAGEKWDDNPVAGRSYIAQVGEANTFRLSSGGAAAVETILRMDGEPCFVSFQRGGQRCFLLGEERLADIDTPLASGSSCLREWYAQLIGLKLFFRCAFPGRYWSAPRLGATLIVDDPPLKKRYGFIQMESFLRAVRKIGCAATFAFIPYNYRRTDPEAVAWLKEAAGQVSLCVHGCDHTANEFAGPQENWLLGVATCALDRMGSLQSTTGLRYEKVFIFPQGRFSLEALRALREAGLNTIVNSIPAPINGSAPPITIKDLLGVAVTRYESLPLFLRRSSVERFDLAFDALFEKPVFACEHHDFFRDGYAGLQEFVRDITGFSSKLHWLTLEEATSSACLYREVATDRMALRHYRDTLRFRNPAANRMRFAIEKPEGQAVSAVMVGESAVPFSIADGVLKYEVWLESNEELDVTIIHPAPKRALRKCSFIYRANCFFRRFFSEIRDNHLARGRGMHAFVQRLGQIWSRGSSLR